MTIDDEIKGMDLKEPTEYGEVAKEMFLNTPGRSNFTQDEMVLLFINKAMFKGLNMDDLSPVDDFIELKKSVGGWNVEMFVNGLSGINSVRTGGGFMSRMGDALFKRN